LLSDERVEISKSVSESPPDMRVAGIGNVGPHLPPIDSEPIVLKLDQLGLGFIEEPDPRLKGRTDDNLNLWRPYPRRFDLRRQRWLFLDQRVVRTPPLPEPGQLDRP
jgi:hypothetical protein